MILQRFSDADWLAADLAMDIGARVASTRRLVLGLPTGRTPLPLYRALRQAASSVDWSRVTTFNLDEFVGRGRDGSRYRRFMDEALFSHIALPAAQINVLDGRALDLEGECRRYESAIVAAGGVDLQVLGIGANGHIGFNEPAAALHARTHVAPLEEQTRQRNAWLFDNEIARVPRRALSMGVATILAARDIVLVATGEEKREAVRGLIEGNISTSLPASLLQLHPRVRVLVDEAAASGLSRR